MDALSITINDDEEEYIWNDSGWSEDNFHEVWYVNIDDKGKKISNGKFRLQLFEELLKWFCILSKLF